MRRQFAGKVLHRGHCQAVAGGPFGQYFNEAGCQLFIAHAHNSHPLVANDWSCLPLQRARLRFPHNQFRLFQQLAQTLEKCGGGGAINRAMVDGQAEDHRLPPYQIRIPPG